MSAPWSTHYLILDHNTQFGHDYAQIGRHDPVPSHDPEKSRGCAVHQDAAARPAGAFRPARTELLRIRVDSGGGHRLWSGAARTCAAGTERDHRRPTDRQPEALPGKRRLAALFGTAKHRPEDGRSRRAAT